MNGFFLVDKPKGKTSQRVVTEIKKRFHLHKCGHSGTLDPDTTGLLVVGCDEATKLMRFIQEDEKCYQATIIFGFETNTLDISGNVVAKKEMVLEESEVMKALFLLSEKRTQIPPMVSAIKVEGRKLYQYERSNSYVEVKPRDVIIHHLEVITPLHKVEEFYEIEVRISCSKGFYVRSFARDLGYELGGFASLKSLRRLKSGRFSIDMATPLEELEEGKLIQIKDVFTEFTTYHCNDFEAKLVSNGVILNEKQLKTDIPFYVLHNGSIIAIYEVVAPNRYKPVIIFKK